MNLDTHPTIIAYKEQRETHRVQIQELEAKRLKKDALAAGAADIGLIDIARESMASYREDLLKVMPETVSPSSGITVVLGIDTSERRIVARGESPWRAPSR